MVERFMADELWTQDTMVSILRSLPDEQREALAVSDARHRLTWGDIDTESHRVGEGLRALGLKRGELVIVQLPNWVENLVVRYALRRVGLLGVYTPVVWRETELLRVVRMTQARAIVAPSRFLDMDHQDMFQRLQSEFQDLRFGIFVRADSAKQTGTFRWEELTASSTMGEDREAFEPWEVSLLSVTSGSTGVPKLCEWPEAAQLLTGRGLAERLRITADDAIGIFSPLDGGAGAMAWLIGVTVGARMVLVESFHAMDILETIERERVSVMSTVPAILLRILDLPELSRWDLRSLRLIRTGTAALHPRIAREAERRLKAKVVPAAGSIEAITFTQTSPDDPPEIRLGGFVGKPLPGGEVRIVGKDGTSVPIGEAGLLEIQGAYTGSGYFRDPESTKAAWGTLGPDGWLGTGDMALMSSDGNISIVGRAKDLIVRGGRNVFPTELETILLQHPAVQEAVVVGIPHEKLGEATRACIVARRGQNLTEADIRSFLNAQQIATYKSLDEIYLLAELPKLPGGKVNRQELATREFQPEERRSFA
jgi:2,3-dihydroxybenzoate-AMP ligase/acyl-CoA synthetase